MSLPQKRSTAELVFYTLGSAVALGVLLVHGVSIVAINKPPFSTTQSVRLSFSQFACVSSPFPVVCFKLTVIDGTKLTYLQTCCH